MPRYAYFVILGLGVLGLWLWQSESVQDVARDILSASTTDSLESESEAQRPLTPEERSAYIAAISRALRERIVVYNGRLRMGSGSSWLFGIEYVPIPLISVRCNSLFGGGLEIRGPGGDGEGVSPASMSLSDFLSADQLRLHRTVRNASDGAEVLDEVCRMVIDELDRLSAQPPR